jgi:hypothetical protein
MSKSKHSYIDLFNSKVEEFIHELNTSFPEVRQFASFKTGFSLMRNIDHTKPVSIFHTYVYDTYKDYIKTKNESFFLSNAYDLSSTSHSDYWQEFIDNIRAVWKQLDSDEKDVIWKYFHILIVLDEKVNGVST